jgi:hypothetical protein
MVCSWCGFILPKVCPSALHRASQDGMDGHSETRRQVKQGLKTLWESIPPLASIQRHGKNPLRGPTVAPPK